MKEIPWERTTDGTPAQLKESRGKYLIPVLALLTLANAKMTEPTLISASFNGETVLFERNVGFLLHIGKQSEYLGVYTPDTNAEEEEIHAMPNQKLPVMCMRHAHWIQQQDSRLFREASDMRAYVAGDNQITSRIMFLTEDMSSVLKHLIEEVQQIVRQGVTLKALIRPEPRWNSIQFEVIYEAVVLSLSYSLHQAENSSLETWIEQWQKSFATLDQQMGVIPDQGCFMSYPRSLFERIEQFPAMSFTEYYAKLSSKERDID